MQVIVGLPATFRPFATYLVLIREARRQAPESFAWRTEAYEFESSRLAIDLLLGRGDLRPRLESGAPLGQEAPTFGTLVVDVLSGLFGLGGEQKPGPDEGQQYGSGWWTGREEIFVAGEPAGAESWFPVNGHPADKATYTLRLTVPKPFAVVANGTLIETIDEGATTTTVWDSRDPMASYLVTLHAGRFHRQSS